MGRVRTCDENTPPVNRVIEAGTVFIHKVDFKTYEVPFSSLKSCSRWCDHTHPTVGTAAAVLKGRFCEHEVRGKATCNAIAGNGDEFYEVKDDLNKRRFPACRT